MPASTFVRNEFLDLMGYVLVSCDWVRPLAHWIGRRRCLEIMCGAGCLSKALRDCGVEVIATDNFSWVENQICWYRKPRTLIQNMSAADAIQIYGTSCDLVISCWPYTNDDAYEALLKMRRQNPEAAMLYIGEWRGGNTANDKFFDAAVLVEDSGFQTAVEKYRHFWNLKDFPCLVQ